MTIRNTSAIPYNSIQENYPVAGIDNNSQGFRDNFYYIKTGLSTASSEITLLNTKAALLDEDNDFNGVTLSNARTTRLYPIVNNGGTINSSSQTVSVEDSEYHYYKVNVNNVSINFDWTNASNGLYAKIRLVLENNTSGPLNVTFTSAGAIHGFLKDNNFPSPFTLPAISQTETPTTRMVVEAWTSDHGQTVFLKYLGAFN